MSDTLLRASPVARHPRELHTERHERIYQSLPPLGSPEYLSLLKTSTAAELPASVLARAYRRLYPGPAADATLERLVGYQVRYRYLDALYEGARRRVSRLHGYTVDDLVHDTIGEIVVTLGGPRGENAERAWVWYLHDCLNTAYRKLAGRREQRLEIRVDETPEELDPRRQPVDSIPWQGCVAPSGLEWLEGFIERTAASIVDDQIRAIAINLFSHTPMRASSDDPNDPNTLTGRFRVTRSTIYTWQRCARAILRDALEHQNEHEVDTSCLKPAA